MYVCCQRVWMWISSTAQAVSLPPPPLLLLLLLCLTTALFFIGVLSAVPLLSVLCSLPPSIPHPLPLPPSRSLFGQFNQGAARSSRASLLSHHAVSLSGEKYSLQGFSHSLSFSVSLALSLCLILLLSSSPPSPLPLPLFSPSPPPFFLPLYVPESLFHLNSSNKGAQQSNLL